MVSSPNYDRLKTFMETARVNKDLSAWDKDHEKAVQVLRRQLKTCTHTVIAMDLLE